MTKGLIVLVVLVVIVLVLFGQYVGVRNQLVAKDQAVKRHGLRSTSFYSGGRI